MLFSGHFFSWRNPNLQMVPFSLFWLACKPCICRERIVWKLGCISYYSFFASQNPTKKLTNQTANTPRKQPIKPKKANPLVCGNPHRGIIYLEQTDKDRQGAWKRRHSSAEKRKQCPASSWGVWVASAPLSRGLLCPAGTFLPSWAHRGGVWIAWVCGQSSCAWAAQALVEHKVLPQASLCSLVSEQFYLFYFHISSET